LKRIQFIQQAASATLNVVYYTWKFIHQQIL
jgi:hypothetical protein